MNCFAALLMLMQILQSLPPAAVPSDPGVYYRQDDKGWSSLQKATFSDTKTKGLGLFLETGGWSYLGVEAACPGPRASTRIYSSQPTFYVREPVKPDDITLIQLAGKKDRRIFHKSTENETVENKEGFPKQEIRKTVVETYSPGVLAVRPEANLKPGEYLLVLLNTTNSYDFGIDKKK